MSIRRFDAQADGFTETFGEFLALRRAQGTEDVHAKTAVIVRDVRERGGEAVAQYTQRFDGVKLDPDTLTADGIDLFEAAERCNQDVREALDFAAIRIESYHAQQRPQDHSFIDPAGLELGWRWTAVDAVGLYVPGGRASYPSSVLMNAVPARAAGVKRIVMTSPVPGGQLSPAVAYAALRAGVTEFHPIGGAQAVAALAYGAGQLKPVDKIVGPGNAYVAAAKRIVFGDVGIDTIAGPSEITVVADNQNNPEWIAADLLSQAEHDPLAQSILITDDDAWASRVEDAVQRQMTLLATAPTVAQAWKDYGAIVLAPLGRAAAIVNQIAPEHVELAVADPDAIAKDVRHAGAIFLGRFAPEALGDYVTGSNHVLPTSGAARFASGLSVLDFMKRTSIQRISEQGFRHLAQAAETLAKAEGLPAHGLSVSIRRSEG
ncbi:MAG TPA: histidinol dehydrogenase [Hyphomonadaceae bacterium]|nr:histidinol dehydrogenase [Hyphomonadaceae bacterium]HPI48829.1 histidinol dehydrogenase [Hyphomonadaceae bacterium]